ncbi:MAG: alpha/beta hydrolase [Stackebrandtia sp.]
MVSYAQLVDMDTSKLTGAAEAAGSLSNTISGHAGDVRSAAEIPVGMWSGLDAAAAKDLIGQQPPPLYDASDAFQRGQAALEDLVEGVEAAKEHLRGAHDAVAGTGIVIGADGTVTTPVVDSPETAERNEELARQALEIIDEALKMAGEADDSAIAAIGSIGMTADAGAIPDGEGDSPQDVNEWWDSLSEAEQQAYVNEHPEIIGNLDGVPSEARDQANQINLENELERIESEMDGLDPESDEYKDLADSRRGLDAIQARLDENDDYMLLGLDTEGDGKAIVSNGNPDTADNVFTHVPGTGADLASVDSEMNRVDRMVFDAGQLDPDAETAGIMWLGYDAPDDLFNAVNPDFATRGGDELSSFQEGLRATSENGSHNTVVGHSYGTTLVGHAASEYGLNADNIVFVGSPGVGVDNASDLGINPDNVYSTRAKYDIIGLVPDTNSTVHIPGTGVTLSGHGPDPTSSDFGGQRFESDDGTRGDWKSIPIGRRTVDAHSEYWDDGNEARDNMGLIITGNGDEVTGNHEPSSESPGWRIPTPNIPTGPFTPDIPVPDIPLPRPSWPF